MHYLKRMIESNYNFVDCIKSIGANDYYGEEG